MPPVARPNSGRYELVVIWYSSTASCETVERAALIELSVKSAPSTWTSVERPRWPPMFSPDVGAGQIGRPLSRPTVEIVSAKPVALLSLIGRFAMRVWSIVLATFVLVGSIS